MSEVKRYDAVHLRYEENNIRYSDGCEVEVVTATDYDRELHTAIAAGIRMQDKCAAVEAECERLRGEVGRLREAFKKMRNVAAGYSNYCEESASTRRLEREFKAIDDFLGGE